MTENEKESILDLVEMYSIMNNLIVYFRPKNCQSALLIINKESEICIDVRSAAFLDPLDYQLGYTIEINGCQIPNKISATSSYEECINGISNVFVSSMEDCFIKVK